MNKRIRKKYTTRLARVTNQELTVRCAAGLPMNHPQVVRGNIRFERWNRRAKGMGLPVRATLLQFCKKDKKREPWVHVYYNPGRILRETYKALSPS